MLIESESSKYNLNMMLANFAPSGPTGERSQWPAQTSTRHRFGRHSGRCGGSGPQFDPQAARDSLKDFLTQLFNQKVEADPEFADEHRDLRMEELMDGIYAWSDPSYKRKTSSGSRETIPMKKAPFIAWRSCT